MDNKKSPEYIKALEYHQNKLSDRPFEANQEPLVPLGT